MATKGKSGATSIDEILKKRGILPETEKEPENSEEKPEAKPTEEEELASSFGEEKSTSTNNDKDDKEEENPLFAVEPPKTLEIRNTDKTLFKALYEKNGKDYRKATFEFCFKKNICYVDKICHRLLKKDTEENIKKMPELYVDTINNHEVFSKISFFDQIKFENFEKIYSDELRLLSLSEEDRKNRQQIINIIGYDPFEEYSDDDKKPLYRDLTGLLSDDMTNDVPKAKAAIEVVINYDNIRKYRNKISYYMSRSELTEDEQDQLKSMVDTNSKLQDSINKISNLYGFTDKKGGVKNNKGTLSDVLSTVEIYHYDPGVVNAFDIETSAAIEQVSGISNKAIMDQLKFSHNEFADMLGEQRTIVLRSQDIARKALEAARVAKETLKREELIDRLEEEYKRKKIDLEDIRDFVEEEFKLWDGNK